VLLSNLLAGSAVSILNDIAFSTRSLESGAKLKCIPGRSGTVSEAQEVAAEKLRSSFEGFELFLLPSLK